MTKPNHCIWPIRTHYTFVSTNKQFAPNEDDLAMVRRPSTITILYRWSLTSKRRPLGGQTTAFSSISWNQTQCLILLVSENSAGLICLWRWNQLQLMWLMMRRRQMVLLLSLLRMPIAANMMTTQMFVEISQDNNLFWCWWSGISKLWRNWLTLSGEATGGSDKLISWVWFWQMRSDFFVWIWFWS